MILSEQERSALVAEYQQKQAAAKAISGLGHELTQEKLEEGKALKVRCLEIKGKITAHNEAVAAAGDLKSFGDDDGFLKSPVRHVPLPDGGNVDTQEAGDSYVEVDAKTGERRVIVEDGPGCFGEKTWRAITSKDYLRAMRKYVRVGEKGLTLAERKTLEEGLDPQGGYTVPVDQIARIVERKPTPTRVAGMVSSIDTSREWVEMLKNNYSADNVYTTAFRVTKTGENPTSAQAARVADANLFGVIRIPVHTFMITGVLTNNQVEDSALNVLQWVSDKFRETVDILTDDKVINGTSKGEASGMLLNIDGGADFIASIGTGGAAITPDSLIQICSDIPEQYEDNLSFLFNKTNTFKAIRALKDASNRYLFGTGYQDSGLRVPLRPTSLLEYPFAYSALMPNIASNAFPVLFGDFRGYQLVRRVGFSIQVLRELYAELNQVAVVGRYRFGGQTIEPWRLRALKCA